MFGHVKNLLCIVFLLLFATASPSFSNDAAEANSNEAKTKGMGGITFKRPCLGETADLFNKVFGQKGEKGRNRWFCKQACPDDHDWKTFKDIPERCNFVKWTIKGTDYEISAAFLMNYKCVELQISKDKPFSLEEIQALTSRFLPSVQFDFSGKSVNSNFCLRSTQSESSYVLRYWNNTDGYYSLEFLFPQLARSLKPDTGPVAASNDGCFMLKEDRATMNGTRREALPDRPHPTIGYWDNPGASASWTVQIPQPGKYRLEMCYMSHLTPGFPFRFHAGKNTFTWRTEERAKTSLTRYAPIAEFDLAAGEQIISLTLLGEPLKFQQYGAIEFVAIKLCPVSQKNKHDIEIVETEVLRNLVSKSLTEKLTALKDEKVNSLKELQEKYKMANNPVAVGAIEALINDLDNPDIIARVKEMQIEAPSAGHVQSTLPKDFKAEKNFLQGKWKQTDGNSEYTFWSQGRLAYYENGKRNFKVPEKGYSYGDVSGSFSLENEEGFYESSIRLIDQNTIQIKGKLYKRQGKEDKN